MKFVPNMERSDFASLLFFLLYKIQNIKTKGLIKLVGISKDEARILNETYNVKFGAYGISHTYTRHKKYFLCESDRNLAALNEIRGIKDYKPSKKNKPNLKNKRVGV